MNQGEPALRAGKRLGSEGKRHSASGGAACLGTGRPRRGSGVPWLCGRIQRQQEGCGGPRRAVGGRPRACTRG